MAQNHKPVLFCFAESSETSSDSIWFVLGHGVESETSNAELSSWVEISPVLKNSMKIVLDEFPTSTNNSEMLTQKSATKPPLKMLVSWLQ